MSCHCRLTSSNSSIMMQVFEVLARPKLAWPSVNHRWIKTSSEKISKIRGHPCPSNNGNNSAPPKMMLYIVQGLINPLNFSYQVIFDQAGALIFKMRMIRTKIPTNSKTWIKYHPTKSTSRTLKTFKGFWLLNGL